MGSASPVPFWVVPSAKMDKLATSAPVLICFPSYKMDNVNACMMMNPSTQGEFVLSANWIGVLFVLMINLIPRSVPDALMRRLLSATQESAHVMVLTLVQMVTAYSVVRNVMWSAAPVAMKMLLISASSALMSSGQELMKMVNVIAFSSTTKNQTHQASAVTVMWIIAPLVLWKLMINATYVRWATH